MSTHEIELLRHEIKLMEGHLDRVRKEGYAQGQRDGSGQNPAIKALLQREHLQGYSGGRSAALKEAKRDIKALFAELAIEREKFGKAFEALVASGQPDLAQRFAELQQDSAQREVDLRAKYADHLVNGGQTTAARWSAYDQKLEAAILRLWPQIPKHYKKANEKYHFIFRERWESLPKKDGKDPSETKLKSIVRKLNRKPAPAVSTTDTR